MSRRTPKIVVAGDITIDWLEVSVRHRPPEQGRRPLPNWQLQPGLRRVPKRGGALLLADLIKAATGITPITHQLEDLENRSPDEVVHSVVMLDQFPYSADKKDKENKVYRVAEPRGYAGPLGDPPAPPPLLRDDPDAQVVVIDDAGNGFREAARKYWPAALRTKGRQPVVIYKMSRPLASGRLWEATRKAHARRLVVVINANDLREGGGNISRRLSWERTGKDVVWQSGRLPELLDLSANCDNLVVCFGIEGAVHFTRRRNKLESRLYYDPELSEDGFQEDCPGKMIGFTNAFVAALTAEVVKRGLEKGVGPGVAAGLRSARRLFREGFGADPDKLDYPAADIFRRTRTAPHIADVLVPNPETLEAPDPDFWCILKESRGPRLELVAMNIARQGEEAVLKGVPVGRFGSLKFIDRNEIESFRVVKNLMQEYLKNDNQERPLSIAVFGPPGSGKSLGVSQVARSIRQGEVEEIKCNMAQFTSLDDLIGVFHQVRNTTLRGKTPLVFFDEFDSDFNGKRGWLKYFLAPMQDGEFNAGGVMHPIGKAIFVFAGGTSHTYQEFYKVEPDPHRAPRGDGEKPDAHARDAIQDFKDAKGPDFVSRLRGIVNILGPDQANERDNFFPIRRAMALRWQLKNKAPHLFKGQKMLIDQGVLRALITVTRYEHGLRSMEAILDMSLLSECNSFEQAALPPKDQIGLHTDAEVFLNLVARDVPPKDLELEKAMEGLARAIHEQYRKDHEGSKAADDPAMQEWDQLSDALKKSNLQQAAHIREKLRHVGYDFRLVQGRRPVRVKFGDDEVEALAQMEHERWVAERLLDGWRLGPVRDVRQKVSPSLVSWDELTEEMKDNDRRPVRKIPDFMAQAGFEVYKLK